MVYEYNINPEVKHFGCIIDMLGRAGRLSQAEQIIEGLPVEVNVIVLQVTNQFMKTVKGLPVFHFRQYSDIYLTAEEYQQVQLPWLEDRPDAYRALCVLWASEAFQEKSKKKRHCATKGVNHTFGGDGYIRTAKRMKWQLVSCRHPSMCISGGIGDQTRHIRRSYVVSKRQTDWSYMGRR